MDSGTGHKISFFIELELPSAVQEIMKQLLSMVFLEDCPMSFGLAMVKILQNIHCYWRTFFISILAIDVCKTPYKLWEN